jgi:hypothetical protein
MKKKIAILVAVIMLIMVPVPVLADTQQTVDSNQLPDIVSTDNALSQAPQQVDTSTPDLVINEDTLDLTSSQIQEYKENADNLAEELKTADSSDISQIIRTETTDNEITNMISDMAGEYTDETGDIPVVAMDYDVLVETYNLDKNTTLEVTPLYIVVDTLTETDDLASANSNDSNFVSTLVSGVKDFFISETYATTHSKSGEYSKAFYAVGYGYKLFTITVAMDFYYNGTHAWYKSDFDAHWTRSVGGALYNVEDWTEKREANGTSYQGWCSGVFGEGVVVSGNLISLSSSYIKVKLSCDKDGDLHKYYNVDED